MSFTVHGVIYQRTSYEAKTPEAAIQLFQAENPNADIQGVENTSGQYSQFVGCCENCHEPVLQNQEYLITENGITHAYHWSPVSK